MRLSALFLHKNAYRVDDNGTPSLIFCRAQEDANKNRIYLHEFYTEAEIIKGGTVKPGAVYDALTDSATFGKIILNPLYNINPKNVSKVVDENGEPLVVYHGTGEDFQWRDGFGCFGGVSRLPFSWIRQS